MSEWGSVVAGFWFFWLLDGAQFRPDGLWMFRAALARRRARGSFGPWQLPSFSPWGWSASERDVPFALSPAGIAARPVGAAGRPADVAPIVAAIRWEDMQHVESRKGWLLINGGRFCRDTGHLTPEDLKALAASPPERRAERIEAHLRRWLRPARLRRRVRVLVGRSSFLATCNAVAGAICFGVTLYLVGNLAAWLPARWADAVTRSLPLWLGYALVLHVVAVVTAARLRRRYVPASRYHAETPLAVAALFPPQAFRLRNLVVAKSLPAQHPLSLALALGDRRTIAEAAFNVLSDLRWPVDDRRDSPLAREIVAWHRASLTPMVEALVRAYAVPVEELLAPPAPDGASSCAYCPRCRAQFVTSEGKCPQGVPLRLLARVPSSLSPEPEQPRR